MTQGQPQKPCENCGNPRFQQTSTSTEKGFLGSVDIGTDQQLIIGRGTAVEMFTCASCGMIRLFNCWNGPKL